MPPILNTIGSPFIELHSIDSTNNYAMHLVHAGMALHGTAVFSHEQTKGKGQRGKQWLSAKNMNIALSIILKPAGITFPQLFIFNMAIALGAYQFYNRYTGNETAIKWPNDIYWRDRKAGGILIENVLKGQEWKYAIAGIGLNINQTEFGHFQNKAVSLKQITGRQYDTLELAKELCRDINFYFEQLLKGPEKIIDQYHKHLYKLNEKVKLKKGTQVFDAIIKGVNTLGQLIVEHRTEELFQVGEIEWVI